MPSVAALELVMQPCLVASPLADPQTAEEVRRCVLAEHQEIRPLLDEIDALAGRFEGGDENVGRTLRDRGFRLYQRLSAHLALEDRILLQRLHATGSEGLAERLAREHEEQRELLSYLLERLGESTRPTLLVARELHSFTEYMRADMVHEETNLLAEDVLHD